MKTIKIIIILLVILLLTSCFGNKKKQYAYNKGFKFLFEKELLHKKKDCIAAFERGGFLYFFTNYHNNLYKVTVYKPGSGQLMELPIVQKQTTNCKSVVNTFKEPHRALYLRVANFKSKSFQSVFDNYQKDINKLKEVIDYLPITFRRDSRWNGENTATLINKTVQVRTISDVEDVLN